MVNITSSTQKLALDSFNSAQVKMMLELLNCLFGGILGPIKTGVEESVRMWREQKMYTFFEELNQGKIEMTEQIVNNNDFIHSFCATLNAVSRTRTKSKIQLFARALGHYSQYDISANADEYEEFVQILLDLSDAEIELISVIDKYENQCENYLYMSVYEKYKVAKQFDKQLEDDLQKKISHVDIASRIIKLQRTGLIERFSNYIIDGGGADPSKNVIPRCFLTPIYYRFRSYFTS